MDLAEKTLPDQGEKDNSNPQDGILPCIQISIVPEGDKEETKNDLEGTSLLRQSVTIRGGLRRTFSAPTKLSSHLRFGRSKNKQSDKKSQAKSQDDSDQKMDFLKVPMKKRLSLRKQSLFGRSPKNHFTAIYTPRNKTLRRSTKQPLRKRHHILLIVIFVIIVLIIIIVSVLKVKKHPVQPQVTG